MINIWLMGVKWNQNKENYNVTRTCGKRAARLEGTCGDATGRLAACDFLERPRQSHLHQIFITSDMPPQRSALTRACTRDLGSCHHGHLLVHSVRWCPSTISLRFFLILSDSVWFFILICYILFMSVPYQAMICGSCGSAAISCARFLGSGDGFGWKSALELCRLHQFLPGA